MSLKITVINSLHMNFKRKIIIQNSHLLGGCCGPSSCVYFVYIVVTQTDFVRIVRDFTEGPREVGGNDSRNRRKMRESLILGKDGP